MKICEKCAIPTSTNISIRFSENSLLIAINTLIDKTIRAHGENIKKINIFVCPFLAHMIETVINYPETLQMRDLIDRDMINELCVCLDLTSGTPDSERLEWAISGEPFCEYIFSSGSTVNPTFEPQIRYIRETVKK